MEVSSSDDDKPLMRSRSSASRKYNEREPPEPVPDSPTESGADSGSGSDEEFDVEAILDERRIMGITKYLVKWDGYDLMNATWEPATSFNSEETLMEWARKKPLIEAERERRFDVKRWEKDQEIVRAEFESSGKDLIGDNATLNTDFDSYFLPLPVTATFSPPHPTRASRLSVASDRSSLFVRQDTVPPEKQPTPPRAQKKDPPNPQPQSGTPQKLGVPRASSRAIRAPVAMGSTETPANDKVSQQQAPKRQAPKKAPQKVPKQTAQRTQLPRSAGISGQSSPTTLPPKASLFGSGQRTQPSSKRFSGNSRWAPEKVPDISQLELMKPSDFPSRLNHGYIQPAASLTNRLGAEIQPSGKESSNPETPGNSSTDMAPPPRAQLAENTVSTARSPPTMPRADREALRMQPPMRDYPQSIDSTARPVSPEGANRRRSSEASRQRPTESNSRRRSPDVYSRRQSPGSYNHRGSFLTDGDSYRPGNSHHGDFYRPSSPRQTQDSNRPSRSSDAAPPLSPITHRSGLQPTSTFGQTNLDIASRNSNFEGLQSQPISPVTVSRPSSQPIPREEKEQIARMPVGEPGPRATFIKGGLFFNPGELLVHVYLGPERSYIGPVRVCGHLRSAKDDLLQNKGKGSTLEMWFRELCTIDEWGDLTRENLSNRSWCNAWMEGFEGSNEKLFYMAESLRKTNMAAIYRPSNPDALSWLAYYPSSEFNRLTRSPEMFKLPDGVPICLAVRGPLPDISTRELRNTIDNPNRQLGNEISRLDTSAIHPSRRWQVEPSVKADARVPDETLHEDGVETDPLTDNEGPGVLNSPPKVQEPVVASENTRALGIAQMLQFFQMTIKMTIKDLGTLPNGGIADMFYLHFPLEDDEACDELKLMELWLSAHQVKCWTSRDPRNWEKFHSNCKRGVIIFHESFNRYETLRPKIRSFQWKPHFNFWSIRLQRPLDIPDLQHCHEGSHIQSLFPSSTAMLLTEDVLLDMKRAAMIICWFYHRRLLADREGSKPSKLVLWPNVLTQLDKRLDDPHRNKDDDPCILSIIACIRSANSIDPDHPEFEPSILSIQDIDCPNNNVICLPVPGYGHRTGTEHPDIPKGLTQEERNADHLVEAFAGWTHLHAARFRKTAVVTFLKKDTLLSHWSDWGHVAVLDFRGFCRAYSTDESVLFDRLQNGPPQADHSPNTPRDPPTPRESQDPRVSRRDNAPANPSLSRVFNTQTGRVEPYQ